MRAASRSLTTSYIVSGDVSEIKNRFRDREFAYASSATDSCDDLAEVFRVIAVVNMVSANQFIHILAL